ncbi:hypothetical protein OO013_07680 [Mangrovivirga sp. M17]|uniref:Uncharacterized protein n=1 Tax=Mangrovivirga halotolerans TaxID=2993936 RepID=A0ABT3RQT2_9BACT|nr:hypothetical protein [Mangrovivirga halotolerans]MCX2743739.1 hypothetical protein [Mangrovivirga halotolerans]
MKNVLNFSRNKYLNYTCLITIVSTVIILLYSMSACNISGYVRLSGTLILLQFFSFFIGSFLGFLFGFPAHNNIEFKNKYVRNSSLKEITSWLTKIIVGITLIELKDIFKFFQVLVKKLSYFLVNDSSQVVIIACIIGIFFVLGFIVLYILSVTKIFEELVINDRNIEAILGDKSMNPNELNIDNTLHLDFSKISNSKKQDILNYISKNGVSNLNPILSKRLGKFLLYMKEYDRAAKAYKAAYLKDSEDKYSLLNYCFIKSKYLKDFDSSNDELKDLISKNKEFAPAYYNLACNYNREYLEFKETNEIEYIKKLRDKAEKNLQRAFELDKGLFSEALKDTELKNLDVKQIFVNSKKKE